MTTRERIVRLLKAMDGKRYSIPAMSAIMKIDADNVRKTVRRMGDELDCAETYCPFSARVLNCYRLKK